MTGRPEPIAAHPSTVGPRRKVGRPRQLDADRIADAALAVGFERLTLTAVAERLGVRHTSLYHHVRDRADLARLAMDRLVATVDWPPPCDDWRDYLAAQGWTVWRMLEAHPGLPDEAARTGVVPSVLAHFARVVSELVRLGFDAEDALLAADTVYDLAFDSFARNRQLRATAPNEVPDLPSVDPDVTRSLRQALDDSGSTWFGRKLDLVLDGIASRRDG